MLEKSASIDEGGGLIWQLVLSLIIAWLLIYFMVVFGVKISGKVVYFTALFPYVVLVILGIRGFMLPGASVGINYYLNPDFSKLKDFT